MPIPTATELDFQKEVEGFCNQTLDETELEGKIKQLLDINEVTFTLLRVTVDKHQSLVVVTVTVSSTSHGYFKADVRIRRSLGSGF